MALSESESTLKILQTLVDRPIALGGWGNAKEVADLAFSPDLKGKPSFPYLVPFPFFLLMPSDSAISAKELSALEGSLTMAIRPKEGREDSLPSTLANNLKGLSRFRPLELRSSRISWRVGCESASFPKRGAQVELWRIFDLPIRLPPSRTRRERNPPARGCLPKGPPTQAEKASKSQESGSKSKASAINRNCNWHKTNLHSDLHGSNYL